MREAGIKDILKVAQIEKESFPRPWGKNAFFLELFKRHSRFYVVEDENEVSGYAVVWLTGDEAYIANIAVKPEKRRKGLGSLLLKKIIEEAKELGLARITLEVRKSNAPAISLYKKFGFKIVGIRRKMYSDGEDGLVMEKLL